MSEEQFVKFNLFFDSGFDDGFKQMIINKMKLLDIPTLTKVVKGKKVRNNYKLEDKEFEEFLINYIRQVLGNVSEAVPLVDIKFKEEFLGEIYFGY